MLDGAIRNGIAVGCWLAAGGAISHWFYRRRAEVRQLLYGPDAEKVVRIRCRWLQNGGRRAGFCVRRRVDSSLSSPRLALLGIGCARCLTSA